LRLLSEQIPSSRNPDPHRLADFLVISKRNPMDLGCPV
jgi:hypothetical protein